MTELFFFFLRLRETALKNFRNTRSERRPRRNPRRHRHFVNVKRRGKEEFTALGFTEERDAIDASIFFALRWWGGRKGQPRLICLFQPNRPKTAQKATHFSPFSQIFPAEVTNTAGEGRLVKGEKEEEPTLPFFSPFLSCLPSACLHHRRRRRRETRKLLYRVYALRSHTERAIWAQGGGGEKERKTGTLELSFFPPLAPLRKRGEGRGSQKPRGREDASAAAFEVAPRKEEEVKVWEEEEEEGKEEMLRRRDFKPEEEEEEEALLPPPSRWAEAKSVFGGGGDLRRWRISSD